MRYLYQWSDLENMSKAVYAVFDKVAPENVDVEHVWWVPEADIPAFKMNEPYRLAQDRVIRTMGGYIAECPAVFEHEGQWWKGTFFIECYLIQEEKAA